MPFVSYLHVDTDGDISAEEFRQLLEDGEAVRIVDIRSPSAFRSGHIPGSENVPFRELPSRIDEVADSYGRVYYFRIEICSHSVTPGCRNLCRHSSGGREKRGLDVRSEESGSGPGSTRH